MKRLSSFLLICLACMFFISCMKTDRINTSQEETNHITPDELMYEMESSDFQSTSQLILPDTSEIIIGSRLNNSTLQEMLVIYSHLIMSENQILSFENDFNTKIKESGQNLPSQIEIQSIMDISFESVLTEEQFNKYNEWRITGVQ